MNHGWHLTTTLLVRVRSRRASSSIHRSRASLSPRKDAAMPGNTNRSSFGPRARSRAAAAREGLDVQRSKFDLLPIQSWVAREDLFWFRSLAQHVGNKFDRDARPTIDRRAAHNLGVGNNHVLCTLKFSQVHVEFQPHSLHLNYQG